MRPVTGGALVGRALRLLCAIWGLGFFLVGMVSPWFVKQSWELPLSVPTNPVEAADGTIYCGSIFYNRVQAYDRAGRFLRGWNANANGEFFLQAESPRRIVAYSARAGRISVLDPSNETMTIEHRESEIAYYALRDRMLGIRDEDSEAQIRVRGGLLGPARVQRIHRDGTAEDVVLRRWALYPIQAPFPAIALLLGSGLPEATSALRMWLRRAQRRSVPELSR